MTVDTIVSFFILTWHVDRYGLFRVLLAGALAFTLFRLVARHELAPQPVKEVIDVEELGFSFHNGLASGGLCCLRQIARARSLRLLLIGDRFLRRRSLRELNRFLLPFALEEINLLFSFVSHEDSFRPPLPK